jgi:hypothetical protein
MARVPEVPERAGTTAMDDRDREELMEYRLTERAYGRLIKRFKLLWGIVVTAFTIVVVVVGAVVTYEFKGIANLLEAKKQDIERYARDTGREMLIHRAEIMDAMVAQRANVVNFRVLERKVRLDRTCAIPPTWEQVEGWFRSQGDVAPPEEGVAIVVGAARRYDICDLRELSAVLENRPIQTELEGMYQAILNRPPDLTGRATWGWRRGRGYTKEDVKRLIDASDERRQRGKGR